MSNGNREVLDELHQRTGTHVLMYHSVVAEKTTSYPYAIERDDFEAQVSLLAEEFDVVSVDQFLADPAGSDDLQFVLTFDDGYRNFYDNVYPILKDKNLLATMFLATNPIDGPGETFLSWDRVRELADGELVRFESHGVRHWNLKAMAEADVPGEMENSKKKIEDELGREVRYFSYPFGNHNERLQKLARQSGYDGAFKARMDRDFPNKERFHLGRIGVDVENSDLEHFLGEILRSDPLSEITSGADSSP